MSEIVCSSVQVFDSPSPLQADDDSLPFSRPSGTGTARRRRLSTKSDAAVTALACKQCRSKKVKCIVEGDDGCRRCKKAGFQCTMPSRDQRKCPSSKSHIRKLEDRIAMLEAALREATGSSNISDVSVQTPSVNTSVDMAFPGEDMHASPSLEPMPLTTALDPIILSTSSTTDSLPSDLEDETDNIISRLCGRQWKLNSDEEGQFKFFGPTSSLHFTESVSSSLLAPGCPRSLSEDTVFDHMLDHDTHLHLLDMYWNYQHTVLQVFDKDEFLEGLKTRQGKYYSKALLYSIYTCAARISDRPELRAMVVPSQDDLPHDEPYLVATTAKLLDLELQRPRITTIQASLLMSVIYASLSKDTKGWLVTGTACNLAIDFGLHRPGNNLTSVKLNPRDVKVRTITYWGCVTFDRFWAQYLGRTVLLRCEDLEIDVPTPSADQDVSWDMKIASAWVSLLLIVGHITDALNKEKCSPERLQALETRLQGWYSALDPVLQYSPTASPSLTLLYMEYYSAKIHLHRPTANFGSCRRPMGPQNLASRRICIESAESMADAVANYRSTYGDVCTMSGIGLHMIATATTILIASIAEKQPSAAAGNGGNSSHESSRQMQALQLCVRGLCELEKTYFVARRVRRIIRLILGLCHIDLDHAPQQHLRGVDATTGGGGLGGGFLGLFQGTQQLSLGEEAIDLGLPDGATGMTGMADCAPLWNDGPQVPSGYGQYDIMYNLGSF